MKNTSEAMNTGVNIHPATETTGKGNDNKSEDDNNNNNGMSGKKNRTNGQCINDPPC